jgi:hypothetical protein
MTKKEKIKESYGEYWELIQPDVDENGWVAHWNHFLRTEIQNHYELETMTYGVGTCWRPKSIQGIENNNGWVKINISLDLPTKNLDCWFENKDGMFRGYYNRKQNFFYDEKYEVIRHEVTHYQEILKPKPSIF